MLSTDQVLESIHRFRKLRVLVVGDLFLDEYVETHMQEISREGPIPVLVHRSTVQTAGAAGNLASSITGLGARVSLAAVVGDDARGEVLRTQLGEKGIQASGVVVDPTHPTLTYTKIRSRVENSPSQELFRIDVLPERLLTEKVESQLLKKIETRLDRVDGVILLDQIHQLVAGRILREVPRRARQKGVFVQGSSRDHIGDFRSFDLITPNDREATEALGGKRRSVKQLGEELRRQGRHREVLLTRGAEGMNLFSRSHSGTRVPTRAREVVDVTGAGDSVSSVALLGRLSGWDLETVARVSSLAAAIVISHVGTHHLGAAELIEAIEREGLH